MQNNNMDTAKKRLRIALVEAGNRAGLIEWAYTNGSLLRPHHLMANGYTASTLQGVLGKRVQVLPCATIGGYRELVQLMQQGEVDMLLLFGNPAGAVAAEKLLTTAVEYEVLMACSPTMADMLLPVLATTENDAVMENKQPATQFWPMHAVHLAS